ncbi:MAG: flavodoxin domain-containing protein [Chitinophagales bacterium]
MKGIILYKGKYGATRQYADWLGADLQLPVVMADHLEGVDLSKYDFLVIGSSVYIGKLQLRDWLKRSIGSFQGKKLFLFIVCGTPPGQKDILDYIARHNIPEGIRGQSNVFFLQGRVIRKDLSWMDRMALNFAAGFAKDPAEKNRMKNGYDEVRKENLVPIRNAILSFISGQGLSKREKDSKSLKTMPDF